MSLLNSIRRREALKSSSEEGQTQVRLASPLPALRGHRFR